MQCQTCAGACCEEFALPLRDIHAPNGDAARWVRLHGEVTPDLYVRFECRCSALTPEGRCGIYETRPIMCRLYEPGGADCMETVRRRRTAAQYERIRDESDPPTSQVYAT